MGKRVDWPINNYVCEKIRSIRIERGITLKVMAARAGIPLGSYSGLEMGYFRISLENLFRITQVLGVGIRAVWPPRGQQGPRGCHERLYGGNG